MVLRSGAVRTGVTWRAADSRFSKVPDQEDPQGRPYKKNRGVYKAKYISRNEKRGLLKTRISPGERNARNAATSIQNTGPTTAHVPLNKMGESEKTAYKKNMGILARYTRCKKSRPGWADCQAPSEFAVKTAQSAINNLKVKHRPPPYKKGDPFFGRKSSIERGKKKGRNLFRRFAEIFQPPLRSERRKQVKRSYRSAAAFARYKKYRENPGQLPARYTRLYKRLEGADLADLPEPGEVRLDDIGSIPVRHRPGEYSVRSSSASSRSSLSRLLSAASSFSDSPSSRSSQSSGSSRSSGSSGGFENWLRSDQPYS